MVSLSPASIVCTLANELVEMTSCSNSRFDSKPNPMGTETDMAGRASSVFDMTAVARLGNEIDKGLLSRERERKLRNKTGKY